MEPSRSMLRIFVGCTSRDLEKHRDAVRHLVDMFDEHPVVMGDFGARDGDATDVSLERVRSCDIYVLLLGWRYGTIPADETLSVTHLEYRAAKDAGMPRLIFLADPATEADVGPTALFPAAVRDEEHSAQLHDFRAEVAHDHVAAFFTTPDNAAALVAAALHHLIPSILPPGPYPPNKLPPRAPGFVGRGNELQKLCKDLRAGQSVGLSALVAGLGGIGKSALAAEALATLAADPDAFPGGVTWARCDGREGHDGLTWLYDQLLADWGAPLSSEQLAQAQVAGPEAEVELRERALHARLRDAAPALVLLDNVEVGLPLARALDTLMSLGITALVTARHQPSVARLAVVRLDVLDPDAAAQLFAERYRAQGGSWDDVRDRDATANVVERLGWLPLAIELQAARAALRGMSVDQLGTDLARDRSQGLLGDPLDATCTLRYSFDQSLRTLTPLQCTRFAALGLPGGPDWPRAVIVRLLAGILRQDASASADGTPDSDDEPTASEMAVAEADLDVFAALSLVTPTEGRIRMHPLLREYARELWRQQPHEMQSAGLAALLAGIQALATDYEHDFAVLAREEELIVAALDLAHETWTASWRIREIIRTLGDYLEIGGHWRLEMHLLPWVLEVCREMHDREGEANTLRYLGDLAHNLRQLEQAHGYYDEMLIIRREVGDRHGEGIGLIRLGLLAHDQGEQPEARTHYEQALMIMGEVGDRRGEGIVLSSLGNLARSLRRPEQARTHYERALMIMREVGDRVSEAAMLDNLGDLVRSLGQMKQARDYYEQALAVCRKVGDRSGEAATLRLLGILADGEGQKKQAQTYFEQALAIFREVGHRASEGETLSGLGLLIAEQLTPNRTLHYFGQALAIFQEIGDRASEGDILNCLGNLANNLGHMAEAKDYYERALAIAQEVGDRNGERLDFNNLGNVAQNLGEMDEARDYYERALSLSREVSDRSSEGITLSNLGELASSLGKREQARSYYEQAQAIFREIREVENVRRVANKLRILAQSPYSPAIRSTKRQRYGRKRRHHKKGSSDHKASERLEG